MPGSVDQRVTDFVPYHSVSVGGKTTDTVIRCGGFAQPDAADLKEIVIAVIGKGTAAIQLFLHDCSHKTHIVFNNSLLSFS